MFKIITIPFERSNKGFDDERLNRFVLNKRIKGWRAEFFQDIQVKSNKTAEMIIAA